MVDMSYFVKKNTEGYGVRAGMNISEMEIFLHWDVLIKNTPHVRLKHTLGLKHC